MKALFPLWREYAPLLRAKQARGTCTLSRKITSFCKFETIIVL